MLVIGLDGASPDLLNLFMNQGKLPFFKKMTERSAYGPLETSIPPVTPPAWASITTGMNPGKTGVFDALKIDYNYNPVFMTSSQKKAQELWDYLDYSIIVNLPCSYPPRPIKGVMVSGMYTPTLSSEFTYPASIKDEIVLRFPNYRIELDWERYKYNKERFTELLYSTLKESYQLLNYFYNNPNWELCFFVDVSIDRICHLDWDLDAVCSVYQKVEENIKPFVEDAWRRGLYVFVVSDHGFELKHKQFNINTFLKKQGYLTTNTDDVVRGDSNLDWLFRIVPYHKVSALVEKSGLKKLLTTFTRIVDSPLDKIDWSNTTAFSLSTQQIYVNSKERFIKGKLDKGCQNSLIDELRNKLLLLKDPDTDLPIVDTVYSNEELYWGRHSSEGPDLVVVPQPDYYISQSFKPEIVTMEERAYHSKDGIIFMSGPRIKHKHELSDPNVVDVAPTILHVLGREVPGQMDGVVLVNAFIEGSSFEKWNRGQSVRIEDTKSIVDSRITNIRRKLLHNVT